MLCSQDQFLLRRDTSQSHIRPLVIMLLLLSAQLISCRHLSNSEKLERHNALRLLVGQVTGVLFGSSPLLALTGAMLLCPHDNLSCIFWRIILLHFPCIAEFSQAFSHLEAGTFPATERDTILFTFGISFRASKLSKR